MTNTERKLIKEASRLANRINVLRFEGKMPTAEQTVRLVEITDQLMESITPIFSEYPRSEGT
jgi:hypothetical protein